MKGLRRARRSKQANAGARRGRGAAAFRARAAVGVLIGLLPGVAAAADPPAYIAHADRNYDVVARRTDAGGTAAYDPHLHRPVDLRELRLGRWAPTDPQADRFAGQYAPGGGFARIEVVLGGLHNPPGETDPLAFAPYAYGPHPVYGFIEIDMDDDQETGGEVSAPQFRYLGNIVRFGGVPGGDAYEHRVAESADAFDGNFLTQPYVERHGEEFHLCLLGGQFAASDIAIVVGDGDLVFESGETWDITGTWFHRAHGFEPYSFATGGAVPGEYSPECVLRFAHDMTTDATTLTLVFPLNNAAAAALRGGSPQSNNHDPSDDASVNEALQDLVVSANFIKMYPTGEPEEALIVGWDGRGPGGYLQPAAWRVTALLGMSYAAPGFGFVWTDAWPDVVRGDVNGENGATYDDRDEISEYIDDHDADDGQVDGRVAVPDFPESFNHYDVNHDGVVDVLDTWLVSTEGDWDADGDVDLMDFAGFQVCNGWSAGAGSPSCGLVDLNADGGVDLRDFDWWRNVATGPAGP